jgi:uncharacterized protein (TIGR03067 family)
MKSILYFWIAALMLPLTLTSARADDAKALIGVWKPEKAELSGKAMPDSYVKAITLKIDKDGYEVTVSGEPQPDKGTCTLDTKSKPKGMVIKSLQGANAGKTFLAIYELKGDTLRVCYDLSGAKRPTEFATAAGTMLYLTTYKRTKK